MNVSVFDTADNVLGTNKVSQKSENFPMSAKSVVMPNISRAVIGTYQAKSGDRGLFFLPDYRTNASHFTFKSFADLLQGQPEISDIDI